MDNITDLLATIDRLPATERADAIASLESILELRQGPRELALGLLALDLAPYAVSTRAVRELVPA